MRNTIPIWVNRIWYLVAETFPLHEQFPDGDSWGKCRCRDYLHIATPPIVLVVITGFDGWSLHYSASIWLPGGMGSAVKMVSSESRRVPTTS